MSMGYKIVVIVAYDRKQGCGALFGWARFGVVLVYWCNSGRLPLAWDDWV